MANARGKNFGPPMTLANVRQNGVRAVAATCEAGGHAADVNVDALAETIVMPEVGRRLPCSQCAAGAGSIRGQHGVQAATCGAGDFFRIEPDSRGSSLLFQLTGLNQRSRKSSASVIELRAALCHSSLCGGRPCPPTPRLWAFSSANPGAHG
jgi:hypothetical protein